MSDHIEIENDAVPLDEWCAEQSLQDRRVEVLAVFRFREITAGRGRDTPQAYAARYAQTEAIPTV